MAPHEPSRRRCRLVGGGDCRGVVIVIEVVEMVLDAGELGRQHESVE
jgi:hypothetical protein